MVRVFIQHEVESYDEFKPVFDEHNAVRDEHGQQGYQLLCSTDDPNDVSVLLEFDTMENARTVIESDELRERMAEAGVKGEPQIRFLDEIEAR